MENSNSKRSSLLEAAQLSYVAEEDFDRIVRPEQMIGPGED